MLCPCFCNKLPRIEYCVKLDRYGLRSTQHKGRQQDSSKSPEEYVLLREPCDNLAPFFALKLNCLDYRFALPVLFILWRRCLRCFRCPACRRPWRMLPFMAGLVFAFCADALSINSPPKPSTAISAKAKDILLMIVAPQVLG